MSKLFVVEYVFTAVVEAADSATAFEVAQAAETEVIGDFEPKITVCEEIEKLDGLPQDWDPECFPYSAAETPERRISAILKEK